MSLLEIKDLHTKAVDDENKKILKGLDLVVNEGEIHVIMGPNGSGKSTLANTIFHSPRYIVESGDILFNGESIKDKRTDEISKMGIFMSFQNPEEIPGVSLAQFLKSTKSKHSLEKVNVFHFAKEVEDKMRQLNMNNFDTSREFNVGFSGGEKKKNEILQMLLLNPKLAILDETDSGLDVDAIRTVKEGIKLYKNDNNSIIIITHNTKILDGLNVDKVHVLYDGKIVCSGDINLGYDIEKNGYSKYIK